MRAIGIAAMLAVISSITGCVGVGDVYTVYVSPAFSQQERADIQTALIDWEIVVSNNHGTLYLNMVVQEGHCGDVGMEDITASQHAICIIPSTTQALMSQFGVGSDIAGRTERQDKLDSATTRLAMDALRTDRNMFRATVGHEVGHGMGLQHSISPLDIMHYFYDGNNYPTINDAQAYELYHHQIKEGF